MSSEPIQGGDYSLEGNFQAAAAWKRVRKRWNAYDWKTKKRNNARPAASFGLAVGR